MKIKNNDLTVSLSNGTKFSFDLTDKVYVKDGIQVPVYRIDLVNSTLPERCHTISCEEFVLFGKDGQSIKIGEPVFFKSMLSYRSSIESEAVVESIQKSDALSILKMPDVSLSKYISFTTDYNTYTFKRNEVNKATDETSFTYLEECSTQSNEIFDSEVLIINMGVGSPLHIMNCETKNMLKTSSVLQYQFGNDQEFLNEIMCSLKFQKEDYPLE